MNKRVKRLIIEFAALIVLFIIDRMTKVWAVSNLSGGKNIWLIPNTLQFYYLPNGNTGAAFGMLKGHQALFMIIAILVVAVIGYILYRLPLDKKYTFLSAMLVFIAAGGVGNMYDRAVQGYVVDFIYFSLINFPIFNVADIYVSVATVLLAVYIIFVIEENDFKEIEASIKAPFSKKNGEEE